MPDSFDRILISGATGAVGSYVLKRLLAHPTAEILCVFRSRRSYEQLVGNVLPEARERVKPVFADLCSEADVQRASAGLDRARRCLAIHCAADVSWTKAKHVIAPLNVEGTKRFARLTLALSRERPAFVLMSTAYADGASGVHQNGYEATKAAAEEEIRGLAPEAMQVCIFRASLVVGTRGTGWIGRFNGLYPLVRLIALAEVPCIVGKGSASIDLIPVDWLADELLAAIDDLSDERACVNVTAAAGAEAISLEHLVAVVQERANVFLAGARRPPNPEISIIGSRQYDFLMKASKDWGLHDHFYQLERVMDVMGGYIGYAEKARSIGPVNTRSRPPSAKKFLPTVVDYWLSVNGSRLLQGRRPSWLRWESAVE